MQCNFTLRWHIKVWAVLWVCAETAAYSLGLSQMLTGTTQQSLDLFKDIISDFEEQLAKRKILLNVKKYNV